MGFRVILCGRGGCCDFWGLRKAGAMVVLRPCVGFLGYSSNLKIVKQT